MQSSFRLRQRRAAIRFLFRLRMSCTTSSCSRVKHCCFSICWKSFLLRDTIWSTESGSAIWRETTCHGSHGSRYVIFETLSTFSEQKIYRLMLLLRSSLGTHVDFWPHKESNKSLSGVQNYYDYKLLKRHWTVQSTTNINHSKKCLPEVPGFCLFQLYEILD